MSKKQKILNRRTFIKGIGQSAIALPLLEIMLDSNGELLAQDNTIAKKFVTVFCGTAISDRPQQMVYPLNTGMNYDIPIALQPIQNMNLQTDVSVISNLQLVGGNAHGHAAFMQVTGTTGRYVSDGNYVSRGVSADQLIAEKIALKNGNSFDPGLVFCAQVNYPSNGDPFTAHGSHSYDKNATKITEEVSPAAAYRRLFGNAPPNSTDPEVTRRHLARVSVIDLVKGNLDSFVKTLGANDKVAVSNHLDLIRDIEKKIASEPPETGGVCQKPVDQGADPNSNVERYSDENKRAEIFVDLAHMALVCDLHRTAALILSREQSFMNTKEINSSQNFDSTLHDLTHNGSNKVPEYLAYAIQWHVNQFSRLAKKLKDTPEGNGTALDNTAMVFYMEAGHVNSGTGNPHTGDNMFMLVAGGKNLGVNTGVHIKANQDSGAKVFTSLMDLYGAGNKLGSVSGKINGLTS